MSLLPTSLWHWISARGDSGAFLIVTAGGCQWSLVGGGASCSARDGPTAKSLVPVTGEPLLRNPARVAPSSRGVTPTVLVCSLGLSSLSPGFWPHRPSCLLLQSVQLGWLPQFCSRRQAHPSGNWHCCSLCPECFSSRCPAAPFLTSSVSAFRDHPSPCPSPPHQSFRSSLLSPVGFCPLSLIIYLWATFCY